jgi:hypothetical protein
MKKSVLILSLIALLALTQIVSAEIVFNNFEDVYNKGEPLQIEVSILRNEAVNDGSLDMELVCESVEFAIPDKTVSIDPKITKVFNINDFKIPAAAYGDCHIGVKLSKESLLEEKSSTIFEVSDELKADGDFQVNPSQLQLGNTLTLYGYLTSTKEGAEQIKGLATIYFKTEDKTYYAKDVEVSENKIKFSYNAIGNKPGEYFIDILVEDAYGNKKLFSNVAKFKILDNVYIFVEPIQTKVLPGSTLHLSGELSTTLGESIKEGNVEVILLDEPHNVIINDGKFSYDLKLPTNIGSGEQTITFSFEEDTGNKGSTARTIQVEPVPTEIKLNTFQTILKPQEVLEVAIYIYDQGNEEIQDTLKVELVDTNGKSAYLGSVESEEKLSIIIPQHGVPGVWKLKASYQGLTAEKTVNIDKVKNVAVRLEDQILYITNTGNVDYNEPVSVSLNDGEFTLNKEVSLRPGGVLTVDLADEAPYGQYNLKVTGAAVSDNQFDNILIKGKNKKSLNLIYSALLIFVITALAYLTIFKKRHFRNSEIIHYKNVADGKRKLRVLKDLKKDEDSKKPRFFTRERGIADFKQRVLKDIKETEDKYKDYRSLRHDDDEDKSDDDIPKGMFNMFN